MTNNGYICQAFVPTGVDGLRKALRRLREAGYKVCTSHSVQLTQWGRIKMTLVSVMAGVNGDTWGASEILKEHIKLPFPW